jgi:AraC-like DNA-binding protein
MVTAEDLRLAHEACRSAEIDAASARQLRKRLIRQALAEGWTHARVAEVLGLSRGRISQL